MLAAAEALERGDVVRLGELMTASHVSQRDLYEVSVPEVDAVVERLLAEGALGARLTGGGFGGSVVAVFWGLRARRPTWFHDELAGGSRPRRRRIASPSARREEDVEHGPQRPRQNGRSPRAPGTASVVGRGPRIERADIDRSRTTGAVGRTWRSPCGESNR